MSKTKKIFAAGLAVVALCAACVAGTAAYFNAKTGPVTNTFAAGTLFNEDGGITLDESKATQNADGTYTLGTDRVTSNEYKGVLPGVDLPKDPVITVSGLEQNAYLFITVDDTLDAKLTWTLSADWTKVADGVYAYKTVLAPAEADQTFGIIEGNKVVVAADLEGEDLGKLIFNAYICQATGFDSAAAAWTAVFAA